MIEPIDVIRPYPDVAEKGEIWWDEVAYVPHVGVAMSFRYMPIVLPSL